MPIMGSHMAGWGWGGLIPFAGMLLFWIVVILLIVYVLRSWGREGRGRTKQRESNEDRPLTVLRERYARGEIDREEYEERLRTLTGETPTA